MYSVFLINGYMQTVFRNPEVAPPQNKCLGSEYNRIEGSVAREGSLSLLNL